LILFAGGALSIAPFIAAQDGGDATSDTTAEPDPVVAALERDKAIAELRKAIAEAEKAELDARLPTTEGSGVEGTIRFGEGAGYFAELLAYDSLAHAAETIAGQLKSCCEGPQQGDIIVIIEGDQLPGQMQLWELAHTRIEDTIRRINDLLERYTPPIETLPERVTVEAVTAAAALLAAAADIASFFRSDLAVTARKVNVTPTALLAEMADDLRLQGWKTHLPSRSLAKTQLLTMVEDLLVRRHRLAARRLELERDVQRRLRDMRSGANPPGMESAQSLERALAAASAEINAVLTATDSLVKALTEGQGGTPSALEMVSEADAVRSNPSAKLLQLEISGQGGEVHATKSAFRSRLTYVGGVAVSYLLVDTDGTVRCSGVVPVAKAKTTRIKDSASVLAHP
jgi:hypothetical protein